MKVYLVYETVKSTSLLNHGQLPSRLSLKGLVIADNSRQATQYFEPEYEGELFAARLENTMEKVLSLMTTFAPALTITLNTTHVSNRDVRDNVVAHLMKTLPEADIRG